MTAEHFKNISADIKQRLFTPNHSLFRDIFIRLGIVIFLIAFASLLLWFQREGLHDQKGGEINLLDTIYFTVMTLTTTGYGDIAPISTGTRSFITFTMTPIRIIIWFIFVSAAYQLILRSQWELWKIKQMNKYLKNHVIICGFGVSGQTAAKELINRGYDKDKIVVIDPDEKMLAIATAKGLSGICGDATKERNLKDLGVDKAKSVIVTVHQDGACTLICLTVKDLNPSVHLVAACKNQENRRLIYQSGAEAVIAPSVAGGSLLATAISSPITAKLMDQLITFGEGLDLSDRIITKSEAGLNILELQNIKNMIILGIKFQEEIIPFDLIQDQKLQEGDVVVIMKSSKINLN